MHLCDDGHEEVVYEDHDCPVCSERERWSNVVESVEDTLASLSHDVEADWLRSPLTSANDELLSNLRTLLTALSHALTHYTTPWTSLHERDALESVYGTVIDQMASMSDEPYVRVPRSLVTEVNEFLDRVDTEVSDAVRELRQAKED